MNRRSGPRPAYRLLAVAVVVMTVNKLAVAAGIPAGGGGSSEGSGDPRDLVWMLVYIAVALGFSFLCSVAEAVVLSITPSYMAGLQKQGDRRVALLEGVKSNIDRSLAAILTLNTIAHTVGAGGAGAKAEAYFGTRYFGIAMIVLTLLILFFSEIIPKTIGAVHWRVLAPACALFVLWLGYVLYPLIFVSELLTKLLTGHEMPPAFTREEFSAMAEIGAEKGELDEEESRILTNLLRFPELRALDIMTPRTVVFALQQDQTVKEVLEAHEHISFSRIPIFGANRDDITGLVLKTDLLLDQYRTGGTSALHELRRDLQAVPDHASLTKVLQRLLKHGTHILLVVDQYGGLEGIVTLEDVVETMMGIEIVDEADKNENMRELARKKWHKRRQAFGIAEESPPSTPPESSPPPTPPVEESESSGE